MYHFLATPLSFGVVLYHRYDLKSWNSELNRGLVFVAEIYGSYYFTWINNFKNIALQAQNEFNSIPYHVKYHSQPVVTGKY